MARAHCMSGLQADTSNTVCAQQKWITERIFSLNIEEILVPVNTRISRLKSVDRRYFVAADRQKMLCCYWQAEDATLLLTGRRCWVATDRQKMLCCYWQGEYAMLLLIGRRHCVTTDKRKMLRYYWQTEDTLLLLTGRRSYVATDRQKMLRCYG
jgi:hypothetical protein